MRRKGRDSTGKSSDSPRKSSRFSRPSTASNKNTEDSVEKVQEEMNSVSDVSISKQHDEHEKEYHTGIAENSTEEFNRQVEGEEEWEKGKSNDIVKTNVEQSRDIIEPESENENVQGTAQSPSKDKDENIQNVNDLQTNLEENEENQQTTHPNVDKTNQECEGTHFESEYLQETETNNENSASNRDECSQELQNSAKKSATPEPADHKLNRSLSNESNKSKPKEVTERRKITLRRSPPVKERRSSVQETGDIKNKERRSSVQEISDKDIKSKKITLKRPTTEEKNSQNDTETAKEVKRFSTSEDENDKKRRMSTSAEERAQEPTNEETLHRPTTKVKLIRSISLANDVTKNDESNDQIVQNPHRKPVWRKSSSWLSNLTATMYKIDMESIKIVCPTVQFLKENELKLESVPRERKKSESELQIKRKISLENTNNKSEAEEEYGKDTSEEESEPEAPKENIIAFNRKISIVDDTASKLKPPPSPAKNPVSNVLFITNLVRPFTVKQLKELLERTGKIKENGFWTDRIKSKCYVQYHTTEEAETTRNALHGVFWPIGNGKQLIIDYATEEDLKKAQNPPPPIQHVQEKKLPEKENWEPSPVVPEKRFKEKERFEDGERRRRSSEREIHRGKQAERRRSGSRSRDRTKPGKYSHRSYTPEGRSNLKRQKKEEPPPQKLMDDLFLKTKATPSIYWQPLSPEEIATKQKQRLLRMEELKRRIEQTRDRRVRDSRRPPYRRR